MKVNDIDIDAGLIVDGDVHGQYSIDKLADVAVGLGLELDPDSDPRHWRERINTAEGTADDYLFEHMSDAGENLLEVLNDKTQGGFFEWNEGSIWLVDEADLEGEDGDEE